MLCSEATEAKKIVPSLKMEFIPRMGFDHSWCPVLCSDHEATTFHSEMTEDLISRYLLLQDKGVIGAVTVVHFLPEGGCGCVSENE